MSDSRWDTVIANRNPIIPPTVLVGSTTAQAMKLTPAALRRHWFQSGTEVGVCEVCTLAMSDPIHIRANERGYQRPDGD